MSIRSKLCLFGAFLLVAAAQADIIYDNGAPDATVGGSDSTVFQSLNPDFASFDDFVLSPGDSTVTDIHWWGNYYTYFSDSLDDSFILYIFEDDGGHPDLSSGPIATIDGSATVRTDSGLDVGGDTTQPIFYYDLLVDPIALDPNVTYWLGITNDFHWRWQTSEQDGTSYQVGGLNLEDSFTAAEGDLNDHDFDLAFYLTGGNVVPEPASLLLMGMGLVALAVRRKRA